ncbi:MAG: PAS domain S-box protein [Oscillatoria sp. SIO1A7]|nr:PAS domain S-box protein [Oscillatoria sp. SIO1A7]
MKNRKISRVSQRWSSENIGQKRELGRLLWGRLFSYLTSGRLLWSVVSILCAIAGFVLWEILAEEERARIEQKTIAAGKKVKLELIHHLQEQILVLASISRDWESEAIKLSAPAEEQVKQYAAKIGEIFDDSLPEGDRRGFQEGCASDTIAWVNPSFQVLSAISISNHTGGKTAQFIPSLELRERVQKASEQSDWAAGTKRIEISPEIAIVDRGKNLQIYLPAFHNYQLQGFIARMLCTRDFFNRLHFEDIISGYSIAIFDGDSQIYPIDNGRYYKNKYFVDSEEINLYGVNLRLDIGPRPELVSSERSPIRYIALVAGMLMSGLVALLGHGSQTIRKINQKLAEEVAGRTLAERELKKLNLELEHRVEESTAELKLATEKLSAEIEARKIDEQTLRDSQNALMTINAIAEGIISGSRVEQVLEETVKLMGKRFPELRVAYAAALPERDFAKEQKVRLRVMHAIEPPGMLEITGLEFNLDIEPGALEQLHEGEIIIANNIAKEAAVPLGNRLWDKRTGALLAVPLRDTDAKGGLQLRGLLWLEAIEPRQWSAYEIATLAQIGEYLAIAIKESRAQKDKVAAQAAFRESDRRFRVIFHQTFQFMILLEPDGTILEINQTALDFTGYELSEVKGRSLAQMPWWKEEQGAGEQGAGEQGSSDRGAGEHGAGEHGAGEHGAREQGAGKQGAGEQGAGEQQTSPLPPSPFPPASSQLQEAVDRAAKGELVRDEIEILAGQKAIGESKTSAESRQRKADSRQPLSATLDFSIKPVKNEAGQVVLLICEGRDISDRKQVQKDLQEYRQHLEELVEERAGQLKKVNQKLLAEINLRAELEEALLQSQARLAGILDNADDAIISVDETQTINLFNKGAEKMFGYEAEEVLGQNIDILLPEGFAFHQKHIREFGQSSSTAPNMGDSKELFGRCKDGRQFPAEASISQLKLGDKKIFTAILRDITERREADNALRESEERFRTVANFTYDWEYWLGEDGKFIYTSPSCDRITGYSAAEFFSNPELLKAIVHPEDLEILAKHDCAREVEERVSAIDFRIITKSGEVRWLSHVCQSVFADDGRFLGRRASNRDITERQQALSALRESEERFRQIAETIREVFFTISITGEETIYISPAYELVWGRTCESLYRNPRSWLESIHPLDRQRAAAAFDEQIRNKTTFDQEYRIIRPDGSLRWIRARSFPVKNALGEFYRFVGIAEDITDRQQKSEALRQSEATNSALLEAIPDLILRIRQDGTFLDFKPAKEFEALLAPENFLGKNLSEIMPETLTEMGMHYIQKAVSTGEPQVFEYQIFEDGELRDYEDRIVAINADEVLSIVRDITSRKQEEAEKNNLIASLQESQRFIEKIAGTIPNLLYIYDLEERRNVYANREVVEILGYSPEEVEKMGSELFAIIMHPEDLPRVSENLKRFNRALDGDIIDIEYRLQDNKGRWHWMYSREILFARNEDGRPKQVLGTATDITDRKRVEEELHSANEKLTASVKELKQYNQEITLLGEVGNFLQSCLTVEEAYQAIATLVRPIFPNSSGAIFLTKNSNHLLEAVSTWGTSSIGSPLFAPNECWALRRGRAHWVDASNQGLHCQHLKQGLQGHGDMGTQATAQDGQGDKETRRQGDPTTGSGRTRGQGDKGTRRQGDKGTRVQGDPSTGSGRTWGQGDKETRRQGDKETRGQGDKGTQAPAQDGQGDKGAQRKAQDGQHPIPNSQFPPEPVVGEACPEGIGPNSQYPAFQESLCVPMMAQGETLGLLYLCTEEAGQLSESKQRLAIAVAEHIALALANLKLRETLRNQSIRDPLTGLFNRRYLEESLQRELHRAKRNHQSVGIIMIDIDYFKRFNDTFGHKAGDVVLRELGALLQKSIRASDIACRYGGEELTLILPESNLADTQKRASQIRAAVKELQVQYRGELLGAISISLGVACFPEHGLTGEAAIQAADAALYRAKSEGRDRVVVA